MRSLWFFVLIWCVCYVDAKAGGATNATARAIKFKMQPDEAMKILNIEKHEFNRALLDEVGPYTTLNSTVDTFFS